MPTLPRASKHGRGSPWSDDDYNVVDNEGHVGWIVWTASSYTAERDKPWFWSIACKFPNETADRGNAASPEDAHAGIQGALGGGEYRWEAAATIIRAFSAATIRKELIYGPTAKQAKLSVIFNRN